MKLRDMIDKPAQCMGFHAAIYAGGPGSGRRKGSNEPVKVYGPAILSLPAGFISAKTKDAQIEILRQVGRHSLADKIEQGKYDEDPRTAKLYAGGPGSGRHAVGDRVRNKVWIPGTPKDYRQTGTVVKVYDKGNPKMSNNPNWRGEQFAHVKLDDTDKYLSKGPSANWEKIG